LAVDHQEQRHRPDRSDRNEVAERIERHVGEQKRIDGDVAGIGKASV